MSSEATVGSDDGGAVRARPLGRTGRLWTLGLAALGAAYLPVLARAWDLWQVDTYAVHGQFVPLFSAFLVWSHRDRLAALPRRVDPRGAGLIVAALALRALGAWWGSLGVELLSVAPALAGFVLWAHGPARLRAIAFPIGFLALMLPIPRSVVDAVTLPLQRLAAWSAATPLAAAGIPLYRDGVWIHMAATSLHVAEVCNGLRFLSAMVVLGTALGYVSQATTARRVAVAVSAVPIAMVANAVRVAVLILVVHWVGPEMAEGTSHMLIGKAVWAAAVLPLIALCVLLRRRPAPAAAASAVAR